MSNFPWLQWYANPEEASLRVHGNGFVQAELPGGGKMHIWHPDCPRQRVPTPVHNHNHSFSSIIACGALTNIEYEVTSEYPGPNSISYLRYQAIPRRGKDTYLESVGHRVWLTQPRTFTLAQGSYYQFPADPDLVHLTMPATPKVVTFIEREEEFDYLPSVMVPEGIEPDNSFNRYGHYDTACRIYSEALTWLNSGTPITE